MNKGLILVSSKRLLYLCQDVQGKVDMVSLERCIDDVYTQGRSSQSTAAHGSPSAVPSLSVQSGVHSNIKIIDSKVTRKWTMDTRQLKMWPKFKFSEYF